MLAISTPKDINIIWNLSDKATGEYVRDLRGASPRTCFHDDPSACRLPISCCALRGFLNP